MAPIAVTGATGHLGGGVARRLHGRGADVRLVVRDADRAPDLPGAEVAVAGHGDADAMRLALQGVDALYLVSGEESADRLEQHRTAVQAAADAGVGRIVYTSFIRAAPDATFTLARDHFHTEQALAATGIPFVALRNNLYADLLPLFATDGAIRGPAGDGRLAPVARRDIVDVSVVALLDPTVVGPIDVTGPQLLDLNEVAEVTAAVTGRSILYVDETLDEAYASRAAYGAPDWQVEAWVSTYLAIARGEMAVVSDTVARLTGHPATPLGDVVAEAAAAG
ncbi:MAG: SDR family oxidoreductase [Egicoccus sp.]